MAANIDWNNAPEGATHYCPTEMTYPWHKKKNGIWYFRSDSLGWVMYSSQCDLTETMKRLGVIEIPKTENNTLDRHDALQWCLNNLHEFTALGIIGRGYPEGWTFTSDNGELLLCHTFHDPIKKVDFDMMTKPSDNSIFRSNAEDGINIKITPIALTHEEITKLGTPREPDLDKECEFFQRGEWVWCEFIGLRSNGARVVEDNMGNILSLPVTTKFRPLRTQEEIEREEGIKALTEILAQGVGDCEPDEYLASVVWDAGYRKA